MGAVSRGDEIAGKFFVDRWLRVESLSFRKETIECIYRQEDAGSKLNTRYSTVLQYRYLGLRNNLGIAKVGENEEDGENKKGRNSNSPWCTADSEFRRFETGEVHNHKASPTSSQCVVLLALLHLKEFETFQESVCSNFSQWGEGEE